AAGVDAVVAQGYEAGGHRGVFDPGEPDDRLGTVALTRLLVRKLDIPVIAAGGIMDGAGIAAALTLGAAAAQLGTAFIACPESSADAGYRAALLGPAAEHTVMTAAISGRPARCLANRFTALGVGLGRGRAVHGPSFIPGLRKGARVDYRPIIYPVPFSSRPPMTRTVAISFDCRRGRSRARVGGRAGAWRDRFYPKGTLNKNIGKL